MNYDLRFNIVNPKDSNVYRKQKRTLLTYDSYGVEHSAFVTFSINIQSLRD